MNYFRKVSAIVWKDALSEMRTREIVFSVLVFALLVLVIFNFAFGADDTAMNSIAPGILWVTFAFAGVLSLNRSFVQEKENGCFEALTLCPVGRDAIYVGKMLSSLIFMIIIEIITLPVYSFLFNLNVLSPEIIVITLLATIGFAAVGTLFSALAVNTRVREMVLPILFLPVVVPLVICAVNASGDALDGKSWGDLLSWLMLIIAYDVVFVVVSYLVFEHALEE